MCVTIGLTGCGNEFAKQEYNDAEKIVQIDDRYAKDDSVLTHRRRILPYGFKIQRTANSME